MGIANLHILMIYNLGASLHGRRTCVNREHLRLENRNRDYFQVWVQGVYTHPRPVYPS